MAVTDDRGRVRQAKALVNRHLRSRFKGLLQRVVPSRLRATTADALSQHHGDDSGHDAKTSGNGDSRLQHVSRELATSATNTPGDLFAAAGVRLQSRAAPRGQSGQAGKMGKFARTERSFEHTGRRRCSPIGSRPSAGRSTSSQTAISPRHCPADSPGNSVPRFVEPARSEFLQDRGCSTDGRCSGNRPRDRRLSRGDSVGPGCHQCS